MNDYIRLDVLDAVEIAEMLAHLLGLQTSCDENYSFDELRADVARLTNKLLTSPYDKSEIEG